MFNIGPTELIVILLIALIVFGPKRLPEVGRTVGKSLREFRKATSDIKNELNLDMDDDADEQSDRGAPTGAASVATDQASPNGQVADAEGSEAAGTGTAT